jgi:protein-tyrosine phosphatase
VQVDYIPGEVTGVPGVIGLTHAPGRDGALGEDLDDLRARHGDLVLVSLVSDAELTILGISDLAERAAERDIELVRFPIADHSVPDSLAHLLGLIRRILTASRAGRAVVVHCWAGRGRSGLVAAACLSALGLPPGAAIEAVRRYRRGAVEGVDQEQAVGEFASFWRAREP